jgi:hypothetical protein
VEAVVPAQGQQTRRHLCPEAVHPAPATKRINNEYLDCAKIFLLCGSLAALNLTGLYGNFDRLRSAQTV